MPHLVIGVHLPSGLSVGRYSIQLSLFPNQTAYLQTQFILQPKIENLMDLAPLISSASRSGIST